MFLGPLKHHHVASAWRIRVLALSAVLGGTSSTILGSRLSV
jgi:hypothetical protein